MKNAHAWRLGGSVGPMGHALVPYPVAIVANSCQADHQDLLAGVWLGEEQVYVGFYGWARQYGSCLS